MLVLKGFGPGATNETSLRVVTLHSGPGLANIPEVSILVSIPKA